MMGESSALNAICPYFTMFPLNFPLSLLERRGVKNDLVLDPFCGRGTTNFAARLVGLNSVGVDSSPVAHAIAAAKMVSPLPSDIVEEARKIIENNKADSVPGDEFWKWAYHPEVLEVICTLRKALIEDCSTAERVALRGILLGALHGPLQKTVTSYLSNQCPRTFAPKPGYSVRFWKDRDLRPQNVDVVEVISRRAKRYYEATSKASGQILLADSRDSDVFKTSSFNRKFDWVITSPPYYGMRTYIPDQWLRNWFVGGSEWVDYSNENQIVHSSPEAFSDDLRSVWVNTRNVVKSNARLVVRFGGISDRKANPLDLIKNSLDSTSGWRISTLKVAGTAKAGKRQADSFLKSESQPVEEYDVWASPI